MDEFKEIKGSLKQLREFAVVMAVFFSLLGGLAWWRGHFNVLWFVVSSAFIFSGLTVPNILKPIYKIWMGLALAMGWFVSRIILCALFFLILTPISLVMRITGKDLMHKRLEPDSKTYWVPVTRKADKLHYERQF